MSEVPLPTKKHGTPLIFFAALIVLGAVKVALGQIRFPELALPFAVPFITALFIIIPVFALYRAADYHWSRGLALSLIGIGVLLHGVMHVVAMNVYGGQGMTASIMIAIRDMGMFTWCVGLGAFLALMLNDKNLLIPVSVFLAGFDIFLVLTPTGPVKHMLENAPQIMKSMALTVPRPTSEITGGFATPYAYIGPADFVFMAMFFVALHRFSMRLRTTAWALVPAVLAYLILLTLPFLAALPLLVPIGITVLLVNMREFHLTKEEWASTALVTAIAGILIWWGLTQPGSPTVPSPPPALR